MSTPSGTLGRPVSGAAMDCGRISREPALSAGDVSVLMIYLEPAPYIVGIVDHVRAVWAGRVEAAYVEMSRSQPWDHRIRSDAEIVLPAGTTSAIGEIRRRLASGRYGLLHLAGWGHPVLAAAMLLARYDRIPVTIESDTQQPAASAAWKRAVKAIGYPLLFSVPAVFLPGGMRQASYLRDFGVDDARIRIAQMTVDVEQIRAYIATRKAEIGAGMRERLGIRADAIVVLYLGRLEPHKGIEDLLLAHARVAKDDSRVCLLVVGDGSLRAAVEAAASRSGSIRYAGRLARNAVWDAYCAADIFVLPSLDEPWGLVVNEAMAAGLPVVVSDRVGCADDIVRDDATGLIVPAGAPEAMAESIARLAGSHELRDAMGRKAADLISGWTLRNQAERTAAAWHLALDRAAQRV